MGFFGKINAVLPPSPTPSWEKLWIRHCGIDTVQEKKKAMGIIWHLEAERQGKGATAWRTVTLPVNDSAGLGRWSSVAVFVNRKRRQLCSQSCRCPDTKYYWIYSVADLHRKIPGAPFPDGTNFLQFNVFFGKFLQNIRLAVPLREILDPSFLLSRWNESRFSRVIVNLLPA